MSDRQLHAELHDFVTRLRRGSVDGSLDRATENIIAHELATLLDDRREQPPMPSQVTVHGTLRDDQPVARVSFVDVLGDARQLDFDPATALNLAMQLLKFVQQVGVTSTGP